MKPYAFVDGNYLRTRYDDAMRRFFGKVPTLDYNSLRGAIPAEKLFFYDAIAEPDQVNQQRLDERQAELQRINRTAGCHVREGSVQGRKRENRGNKPAQRSSA